MPTQLRTRKIKAKSFAYHRSERTEQLLPQTSEKCTSQTNLFSEVRSDISAYEPNRRITRAFSVENGPGPVTTSPKNVQARKRIPERENSEMNDGPKSFLGPLGIRFRTRGQSRTEHKDTASHRTSGPQSAKGVTGKRRSARIANNRAGFENGKPAGSSSGHVKKLIRKVKFVLSPRSAAPSAAEKFRSNDPDSDNLIDSLSNNPANEDIMSFLDLEQNAEPSGLGVGFDFLDDNFGTGNPASIPDNLNTNNAAEDLFAFDPTPPLHDSIPDFMPLHQEDPIPETNTAEVQTLNNDDIPFIHGLEMPGNVEFLSNEALNNISLGVDGSAKTNDETGVENSLTVVHQPRNQPYAKESTEPDHHVKDHPQHDSLGLNPELPEPQTEHNVAQFGASLEDHLDSNSPSHAPDLFLTNPGGAVIDITCPDNSVPIEETSQMEQGSAPEDESLSKKGDPDLTDSIKNPSDVPADKENQPEQDVETKSNTTPRNDNDPKTKSTSSHPTPSITPNTNILSKEQAQVIQEQIKKALMRQDGTLPANVTAFLDNLQNQSMAIPQESTPNTGPSLPEERTMNPLQTLQCQSERKSQGGEEEARKEPSAGNRKTDLGGIAETTTTAIQTPIQNPGNGPQTIQNSEAPMNNQTPFEADNDLDDGLGWETVNANISNANDPLPEQGLEACLKFINLPAGNGSEERVHLDEVSLLQATVSTQAVHEAPNNTPTQENDRRREALEAFAAGQSDPSIREDGGSSANTIGHGVGKRVVGAVRNVVGNASQNIGDYYAAIMGVLSPRRQNSTSSPSHDTQSKEGTTGDQAGYFEHPSWTDETDNSEIQPIFSADLEPGEDINQSSSRSDGVGRGRKRSRGRGRGRGRGHGHGHYHQMQENLSNSIGKESFEQIVVSKAEPRFFRSPIHNAIINGRLETKLPGDEELFMKLYHRLRLAIRYRYEVWAGTYVWRALSIAKQQNLQKETETVLSTALDSFFKPERLVDIMISIVTKAGDAVTDEEAEKIQHYVSQTKNLNMRNLLKAQVSRQIRLKNQATQLKNEEKDVAERIRGLAGATPRRSMVRFKKHPLNEVFLRRAGQRPQNLDATMMTKYMAAIFWRTRELTMFEEEDAHLSYAIATVRAFCELHREEGGHRKGPSRVEKRIQQYISAIRDYEQNVGAEKLLAPALDSVQIDQPIIRILSDAFLHACTRLVAIRKEEMATVKAGFASARPVTLDDRFGGCMGAVRVASLPGQLWEDKRKVYEALLSLRKEKLKCGLISEEEFRSKVLPRGYDW